MRVSRDCFISYFKRKVCWTWAKRWIGSCQFSVGFSSQSVSTEGITAGGAWLTISLWWGRVVVLLVRASTSSAEGVDTRGRCLISTDVPKNAAMMWIALRNIEAAVSWGTLLLSQPKTRASLSVRSVTSFPTNKEGQQTKGRIKPIASKVEDLQP